MIVLSGTWLNFDLDFQMAGYTNYHSLSKHNKSDGVSILIRKIKFFLILIMTSLQAAIQLI